MKIYIASSWRNKHGVELLTNELRKSGHDVISWIENCNKEGAQSFSFEAWIRTRDAVSSFVHDTNGATTCDLFIYYGPAGKDACAELGAAWASQCKIIGLWAKTEDLGLMRKMVSVWYTDVHLMLSDIDLLAKIA